MAWPIELMGQRRRGELVQRAVSPSHHHMGMEVVQLDDLLSLGLESRQVQLRKTG